MQWLQSVFGSDGSPIVQYVAIFAVIFAVLTAIVLVVRRFGGGGLADAKRAGQRGRQPRLGIVDVYELDRQRQLILLRRDNVEHLLLVGGPNDVVIERHIQRGQTRDPSLRPEAMAEPVAETFPDLPGGAFPGLETRADAAFQPAFAMPVVLAPAVPGSGAAPPVAQPLDVGALDGAAAERPSEAVVPGPRPETAARRAMRRTTPPPINPHPDGASERTRAEAAPEPESPAFDAGARPPPTPAERRAVDPAVLSDMARQLEAALARPASAVTPPPVRPAPAMGMGMAMPEQVPDQGSARAAGRGAASGPDGSVAIDPMAAAMAAPAERPSVPGDKPDDALFEPPVPPAAAPNPAPEPFLPAPPRPEPRPPRSTPSVAAAPVVQPVPPAEPAPQVERAPAPVAPKSAANPFSVEEIEAEFARLLGRPLDKRS